jgi:hypothetical protein
MREVGVLVRVHYDKAAEDKKEAHDIHAVRASPVTIQFLISFRDALDPAVLQRVPSHDSKLCYHTDPIERVEFRAVYAGAF